MNLTVPLETCEGVLSAVDTVVQRRALRDNDADADDAMVAVTNLTCHAECRGRCFGEGAGQCCDSECAGGCHGAGNKRCWVIAKFH